MNYNYVKAPLPFQGQKRRFLKPFKEVLEKCPSNALYVDLFGGSGLLSHTVKNFYPESRVIYNDFDNYSERLKNIEKTKCLLNRIKEIIQPIPQESKIPEDYKKKILDLISKEKGFVDYITISSKLLFSMNFVLNFSQLEKGRFYNNLYSCNYNCDGYLKGVEIESTDYKELFAKYKDVENVIFLIDPPYLSTDVGSYKIKNYWKLSDYLDVLKTLEKGNYFYFTSEKSQLLELGEWLEANDFSRNPFHGAKIHELKSSTGDGRTYKDLMIYKV